MTTLSDLRRDRFGRESEVVAVFRLRRAAQDEVERGCDPISLEWESEHWCDDEGFELPEGFALRIATRMIEYDVARRFGDGAVLGLDLGARALHAVLSAAPEEER